MGLLPDLATVRDRATHPWRKRMYNAMSFGWTGSQARGGTTSRPTWCFAALATPLVFSVHTIVSFDFATSVMPGWHTTIFPPYFVIGAIFSGFAMVITLMTFARYFRDEELHHPEPWRTWRRSSCSPACWSASPTSPSSSWRGSSGNAWEGFIFKNRVFGPYWWAYTIMFTCNAIIPQVFWVKSMRRNTLVLFIVHPRERRHVVRALRHRRDVAATATSALVVGHVSPDVLGLLVPHRIVRVVLHAVPPLRAHHAGGRDFRK